MKRLGALLAGIVIFVAMVLSLDEPGGPVQQLSGVVKGTVQSPMDTGPSVQVATVALGDGRVVQASVALAVNVHSGQRVQVNEMTGIMTSRKTYSVVGIEASK